MDIKLLQRILDRPEIHAGSRKLSAVLGFFSGYNYAQCEANLPPDDEVARIWEAARISLCKDVGLDPNNSLAISQLVRRKVGRGELRGFDELRTVLMNAMNDNHGG